MSQCFRIVRATFGVTGRWALLAVFLLGGDSRAWAQIISPGPFIHQDTLVLDEGENLDLLRGPRLVVVGDTALVATIGNVFVYERDNTTHLWTLDTQLTPDDGAANFGRAIDFDGRRAIVGATNSAYIFRKRNGALGWQQVARLVPSDGTANFGADVAIDGRNAFVGAIGNVQANTAGSAFAFRSTAGAWHEVKKLAPPASPTLGFGGSIDISGNKAIVGTSSPQTGRVFIFGRNEGGADNWGLVKDLGPTLGSPSVAIDGDTALVGAGEQIPSVRIFGRNEGGPDAWGIQAEFGGADPEFVCCGAGMSASISGDYAVVGAIIPGSSIQIRARNQGGPNAWGLVSRFSGSVLAGFYSTVSIHGDTVLFDADPDAGNKTVSVYVSDVDGDGIRDGLDPCLRDPLNSASCQRSTVGLQVLDDLIVQSDVTTETHGKRQLITATFTNTSATAVRNPFFAVTELTGGNVLLNADGGPGGVGATLSPDVGDGTLSPGESMRVTFRIRLQSQQPYQFSANFHGEPVQ